LQKKKNTANGDVPNNCPTASGYTLDYYGDTHFTGIVLQHLHAQLSQLQNLVLVCDGTHFTNNFWRCVHSALVQELQEGLNGEAGEVLDHHLAKPPKNKIEPCRNEVSFIS